MGEEQSKLWTHRHSLSLRWSSRSSSYPFPLNLTSASPRAPPAPLGVSRGLLVVLSMDPGHSTFSLDGDELNVSLQLYVPNCSSVEEVHCQTPARHGGPSSWMFGNERCHKSRRCFRSLVGLGLISVLGWVRAVEAMPAALSHPSRVPSQRAAFLLYDLYPWLRFGSVLAQGDR